jgi:hypothetical protein
MADLRYLRTHRIVASRQGAEKLSFDDFSTLFDAEQIFHAAMERPRELKRNRSSRGILIRLECADRLPRYSSQIRQLFLRERQSLSFLAQTVLYLARIGLHTGSADRIVDIMSGIMYQADVSNTNLRGNIS